MADIYFQLEPAHAYYEDQGYPYRYYTVSPVSGSVSENGQITISYTLEYYSSWSSGKIQAVNFVEVWFYDASGNLLDYEDASSYASSSFSGASGSTTIDMGKCTNAYKSSASKIEVLIETETSIYTTSGTNVREVPVGNSNFQLPAFTLVHYTVCGAPTSFACSPTLTDGTTTLSWSGAKAGTANAISSYEIQYCESSDGKTWGSWQPLITVNSTATSGSKVVSASATHGNYRKFRIRTCGAAGSAYYSGWKESTNTLRRDHAALAGFTDSTLTAGTSLIKAVHMTELQDRVNTLRTFYGLSKYSFTTITAGTTSLAGWTNHVNQIRTAIEEVCTASGKTHEDWISFSVNCPRADVIQQLRDVVLAL